MAARLLAQRLLALFIAALLLFDFPLLGLWQGRAAALFAVWAAVIVLLAWLMERRPDPDPDDGNGDG
jgi:hypothetical protein